MSSMIVSLFWICVAFLIPSTAFPKIGASQAPEFLESQYIVTNAKDPIAFQQTLSGSGFKYVEELPFGFHLVESEQKLEAGVASARLMSLGVRSIQRNYIKRIAASANSHLNNQQWALDNPATGADIRAKSAWQYLGTIPSAQKKIRVAIIDSGIDLMGHEFDGRIDLEQSYNFVGSNSTLR